MAETFNGMMNQVHTQSQTQLVLDFVLSTLTPFLVGFAVLFAAAYNSEKLADSDPAKKMLVSGISGLGGGAAAVILVSLI